MTGTIIYDNNSTANSYTSGSLTGVDDTIICQSLYDASTGDVMNWKVLKPHIQIQNNEWATTTTGYFSTKTINAYVKKISTIWENNWCRNYGNIGPEWIFYENTPARPLSVGDRLRQMMQARQGPMLLVTRDPLKAAADDRERRARETLQRVLGEDKFRNFLRCGFVSVRAKSGLTYQIFPGHGITCVYRDGQMVERLCVVLTGDFPPTDSLIMRYLIILNNEDQFRSKAVKHPVKERKQPAQIDLRTLPEIYRELRAVA